MSAELERTIAEIWQQLLAVETVGPDENFFELGGNSLLMIQFHNRLQTVLGTSIPIVQLFERPTIRLLAESLRSQEPVARSHQQLVRSKSNPFRPAAAPATEDRFAERAGKQRSASM